MLALGYWHTLTQVAQPALGGLRRGGHSHVRQTRERERGGGGGQVYREKGRKGD